MLSVKSCYLLILLNTLGISAVFAAVPYQFNCPDAIQVSQKLEKNIPGWRSLQDQLYRDKAVYHLDGVAMFVDRPEKLVQLKPQIEKGRRIWRFNANDKIFIVCEYQNTSIQLTKVLPGKMTQCEVHFLKNQQTEKGPIPEYVSCY